MDSERFTHTPWIPNRNPQREHYLLGQAYVYGLEEDNWGLKDKLRKVTEELRKSNDATRKAKDETRKLKDETRKLKDEIERLIRQVAKGKKSVLESEDDGFQTDPLEPNDNEWFGFENPPKADTADCQGSPNKVPDLITLVPRPGGSLEGVNDVKVKKAFAIFYATAVGLSAITGHGNTLRWHFSAMLKTPELVMGLFSVLSAKTVTALANGPLTMLSAKNFDDARCTNDWGVYIIEFT
ncbi:hypothetical protein HK101_002025, partial [Irineochytrium annulatum]